MILTLTPNPAVDETLWVEHLAIGAVEHASESQLDPAGKGVNVSRVVHRLGWPTVAFGFLGGDIGTHVERALGAEGVQHHFERVKGETRINVTIVERATGASTSIYAPGPAIDERAVAALGETLELWLRAAAVLVLAGSLPRGLAPETYRGYLRRAKELGIRTILDADGEALRHGLEAAPDLVKPNRHEAERLLGRKLPDRDAVVDGALEIASRGAGAVVVSLGKEGSICVQGKNAWLAVPPRVELRSSVGSGDSLVAGLALSFARQQPITEGLRWGSAAGAATAASPGTSLGTAADIHSLLAGVRIESLR
jgi:1-phosphofructokinase family hexose kinase